MAHDVEADTRFLDEAVARGAINAEQAADCRRILETLAQVDVSLSAADVAIRRAYLTKEVADEIKRTLARKRVGRYEVLDRLGRGGSGVVWRARDTRLGRIVALKLLARPRTPDDVLTTYHARFQREARTAVTLNHVNIVRGLDYGESDGYVYFAMEFVPGETAGGRLRREGRIPENDALQITLQVVEALQYVARFGLVHRDLKPDNLLVTAAGEVKVCDLGLAKPTLEEASRMDAAGTIAGTPLYMAPEQIEDPDAVDWRTDVYGLGATLYHMLTGRPPFLPTRGGSERGGKSVIERQLHEAVTDPREHVLELSAGASAVVMKMLAKDPARRYADLGDLASDLSAVVDGRPPSFALELTSASEGAVAEVLAESQGIRSRLRRRRGVARRGAAVVVLVLSVGALAWGVLGPTPPPTEFGAQVDRSTARNGAHAPVGDADRSSRGALVPPADPGRGALALARRLERDHAPLDEVIEQYKWVRDEHGDGASGRIAAARLDELSVLLGSRATQELMDRRQAAMPRLRSGNYAAAIDELRAFPALYEGTEAHAQALAEAQELEQEGRARAKQLLDDAVLSAVDGRFDAANAAVEEARRIGLDGLDRAITRAEGDIALERGRYDTQRREQTAAYLVAVGRALMASYDDEDAAAGIVDLAHSRLRTYATELSAARSWLPLARRARVRLTSTWQSWADEGKALEFRSVGYQSRAYSGRAAASTSGHLNLAAGGDEIDVLRPEMLPNALLAEAISPGARDDASRLDEVAAFLLSRRRLADAAAFSAPPELIDAVRAAALTEIRARLARIESLVADGARVSARDLVSDTLSYAPWCSASWTALGALRADADELDGAVEAFEHALGLQPVDPSAHFGVAAVHERRRRFQDAEEHLRAFLDATESTADERMAAVRPNALAALERVAARRLERALETWRTTARKALRERRAGDAKLALEQILKRSPGDPDALFELGRLLAADNHIFPAYRVLRRLVDAHPDHRRTGSARRELAKLERYRAGVPAGREALAAGRDALHETRLAEAISAFRRAILHSPFLVEAHVDLGEALLQRGLTTVVRQDIRAAVAAADDALLCNADSIAALLLRATARVELSEFSAALADAERVTSAKDAAKRSRAHIIRGRALLGTDRVRDALVAFEAAYEARHAADPLYWQAAALERRGERVAAKLRLDVLYEEWGAPPHLKERIERLDRMLED